MRKGAQGLVPIVALGCVVRGPLVRPADPPVKAFSDTDPGFTQADNITS